MIKMPRKYIGVWVVEKNSTSKITFITSVMAIPSIPSIKLIAFTITKNTNTVKIYSGIKEAFDWLD